jgi:PAS domain S-box-containing protein
MDHDFRIIQMNRQALRLDGRDARDIIGLTHWEAWPLSLGTAVETAYRRVMTEHVPLALEHRYVDSTHDIWLDISAYPTSEGIALFYRDISARKHAEERLTESERRLALAMRAGQLGVFEYIHGPPPVSYWDSALRGIWGVDEDVEINEDLFWSTIHPADAAEVKAIWRRAEQVDGNHRFDVQYRIRRPIDGALRWLRVAAEVVFDENGPSRIVGTIRDITGRKAAEEQTQILMREVNHRSKNLLAVVQSIAHQMARSSDPETFAGSFAERLASLAASQDLLVGSQWKGVDLLALVTSQLAHYRHLAGLRIHVSGAPVRINPSAAQNLGMALHELATNAVKHGALSRGTGEVRVHWALSPEGDAFAISWTESGGPSIAAPARNGLGSLIITRLLERSLDGTVTLGFEPSGLSWALRAPAAAVLEAAGAESV